jgi:hypothetical protein
MKKNQIHMTLLGSPFHRTDVPAELPLICPARRVNLVTNPVISYEWVKDREVLRQVEQIRGHLWHRYSISVNGSKSWLSKWWLQLNQ